MGLDILASIWYISTRIFYDCKAANIERSTENGKKYYFSFQKQDLNSEHDSEATQRHLVTETDNTLSAGTALQHAYRKHNQEADGAMMD